MSTDEKVSDSEEKSCPTCPKCRTRLSVHLVDEEDSSSPLRQTSSRFSESTHIFQKAFDDYRPIQEHGLVGNCRTAALVGTDSCIDWYPYPDFDSPSLFASILDHKKGGFFSFTPGTQIDDFGNTGITYRQLYHPDTNVLISRFLCVSGVGQVIDFMPVSEGDTTKGTGWLVRELQVVRGEMTFQVECCPAFNYGRDQHEVKLVTHGARFISKNLRMVLTSTRRLDWRAHPTHPGGVVAIVHLVEGDHEVFVLRESQAGKPSNPYRLLDKYQADTTGHPSSFSLTDRLRNETLDFWRRWISKSTYRGRWREHVYRSALALKLLQYKPTGALVAAATTSLPEGVGGERNWDYRFTWIRDSSFTLRAFLKLGLKEEAKQFMHWVQMRCSEIEADGSLQIMYGIRGEHQLNEQELDHFDGYMGSKPVRIGNGAFDQLQLDIYGELVDTIFLSDMRSEPVSYDMWVHIRSLIEFVCKNWKKKDEGIWEVRGGQQHFIYSKLMCWVAMDRAIRLADRRSFPADIHRWRAVRNEIFEEIQEKGWSSSLNSFRQAYESDHLDASCLVMLLVKFMAPTDPRIVSTVDAIATDVSNGGLLSNNLVYRYNVDHTDDGLSGEEGTFSICTFWCVEALAKIGQFKPSYLERARLMFEQSLGYANHLGLYSEELGLRGEALGNFPQAFTHLAHITAAISLDWIMNDVNH